MSMAVKLSDLVDKMSGANLQMVGMWTCHPRVQRTYRNQKCWAVLPPTCHLGPQPGGCHPVALIQNIVFSIVRTELAAIKENFRIRFS